MARVQRLFLYMASIERSRYKGGTFLLQEPPKIVTKTVGYCYTVDRNALGRSVTCRQSRTGAERVLAIYYYKKALLTKQPWHHSGCQGCRIGRIALDPPYAISHRAGEDTQLTVDERQEELIAVRE